MTKVIDLKKSVYELVKEYPEVADILAGMGLSEVKKSAVLNSIGKLMTIPKGVKFRKLPLDEVIGKFKSAGFEVLNIPESPSADEPKEPSGQPTGSKEQRLELLKSYLRRLNEGEPLDVVQADFVRSFSSVNASEIMEAEQQMLREGAPLHQVQKLCDVHSALFHNKLAEAKRQEPSTVAMAKVNAEKSEMLTAQAGHPLQTLTRENDALESLLVTAYEQLSLGADCTETLSRIREVAVHYAKKGDLLYPQLSVKYGIIGPSQVMWTLDDEIRAELASLLKSSDKADDQWLTRALAVLKRVKEMIYKENNILFPVCAANFTEADWKQIYRDSKDYAPCLGVVPQAWPDAENDPSAITDGGFVDEGVVKLPSGSLTIGQLRAMLNTLPMEISFVDADNINRYFDEGPKVFKRPLSALGREVFSCHPPKIEPMVRAIIQDLRSGKKDEVAVWMEKNGRATLVKYMAVRDSSGQYVGTLEVVQDMEEARRHFAVAK